VKQNDLIALGLAAAVIAGVVFVPRLLQAAPPSFRPGVEPGPGPMPSPVPPPSTDPNLSRARDLIQQLEAQAAAAASPQQKELYAQALDNAAFQVAGTNSPQSAQAAAELRAAAVRVRGGGMAPPNPVPPQPQPAPPATEALLDRYTRLRTAAVDYLNDTQGTSAIARQTAAEREITFAEMDRTARDLVASTTPPYPQQAADLTTLASLSYAKSNLPRPVAQTL
jgi:hypothetical protein